MAMKQQQQGKRCGWQDEELTKKKSTREKLTLYEWHDVCTQIDETCHNS